MPDENEDNSGSFNDIPMDILREILKNLSLKDFQRLMLTNKAFLELSNEFWKEKFRLYFPKSYERYNQTSDQWGARFLRTCERKFEYDNKFLSKADRTLFENICERHEDEAIEEIQSRHRRWTKDSFRIAMTCAIETEQLNIVQSLAKQNVSISLSNLIQPAAECNNLDIFKCLVEGPRINATDPDGRTSLHFAIKKGNLDLIKYCLDQGADINQTDFYGRTPLHVAAGYHDINLVSFLVNQGAKIQQDHNGETPLHFAAKRGDAELVAYLVENQQADIDQANQNHKTPLHLAAESGNTDLVNYLIKQGAKDHLNLVTITLQHMESYQNKNIHREIILDKLINISSHFQRGENIEDLLDDALSNFNDVEKDIFLRSCKDIITSPKTYARQNPNWDRFVAFLKSSSQLTVTQKAHLKCVNNRIEALQKTMMGSQMKTKRDFS